MITFIIPSINRDSIVKTINSLLNQTNNNWKCIIIFDGVKGREFNDERIKTISVEKTGGRSNAHGMAGLVRNFGINLCDTEWIGFVDDDDTLDENYVETLLTKYSNYDFVLWRMKYHNGRILPPIYDDRIIFGNVGISFCYKNKFKDLKFMMNRDGEDLDFIKLILERTNNYIVTKEVYYKINH